MASNEIRLIGQTNAAFLLQHPQRRNGVRHDRWLGILSESQIAVWSFTQNTEEMLAQRIINFLKYLPCGGTGFCKRLAHTHGLTALPWKNKSPHRPDTPLALHNVTLCDTRSEEHTSELQSLMRISYAVFCLTN